MGLLAFDSRRPSSLTLEEFASPHTGEPAHAVASPFHEASGRQQRDPGIDEPESAPIEDTGQCHAEHGADTLRAISQPLSRQQLQLKSHADRTVERAAEARANQASLAADTAHLRHLQLRYHDLIWEYEWVERWE